MHFTFPRYTLRAPAGRRSAGRAKGFDGMETTREAEVQYVLKSIVLGVLKHVLLLPQGWRMPATEQGRIA